MVKDSFFWFDYDKMHIYSINYQKTNGATDNTNSYVLHKGIRKNTLDLKHTLHWIYVIDDNLRDWRRQMTPHNDHS